jgi:aromatic-L-amino-acid/L-tryptophan decarboxylase
VTSSESTSSPDPLGLEPAEMRRLAHRVVDLVLDHVERRADGPALVPGDPVALAEALGGPLPEAPGDPDAALDALAHVALGHMQHAAHPRFLTRIPGPAAWAGVLGEWLGTGTNAIAASWAGGAGPSEVEVVVLEWLRTALGMPEGAEGVLLSGGSIASLTALAAARLERGPGPVYLSDQAHASIPRALRALAWADVRLLPSDAEGRLDPAVVAEAARADRTAGLAPGVVVATAGTTNTGAADPLDALADLCAVEGLWLHVDGAHGAAAALHPAGLAQLGPGLARADSLVLDPHKWLFQPYDAGCLLVRHPGVLARAFSMAPEYLADVVSSGEVDFRDRSLELSRRARGLKLWLTFRVHGAAAVREAIGRGIALAEHVERRVTEPGSPWELVTPAQLGIVTFALRGAAAEEHVRRAAAVTASGWAAVSTTTLRGRTVLRICAINPLTTPEDLDETLRRLSRPEAGG